MHSINRQEHAELWNRRLANEAAGLSATFGVISCGFVDRVFLGALTIHEFKRNKKKLTLLTNPGQLPD